MLATSQALMAEVIKGSTVGCNQVVAEFKQITITSEVMLNKNFITGNSAHQINEAIEWQLKHLFLMLNCTSFCASFGVSTVG